jgi:hypothetical protein
MSATAITLLEKRRDELLKRVTVREYLDVTATLTELYRNQKAATGATGNGATSHITIDKQSANQQSTATEGTIAS